MKGFQAEYVTVTASGNDTLSVNAIAMTWSGGEQWGFLGDIESVCGADWYYSDVMVANSDSTCGRSEANVMRNRKSNCIWIDRDHSNGLRSTGFLYHALCFGSSKDPDNDGHAFQYRQHPETIYSSGARYHNSRFTTTDEKIAIFWPQLENNDDGSDKDLSAVTNKLGKGMNGWK
jgi:hypothetical protein